MKITGYEILSCDAGWRDFSFLRLSTDAGVRGISEFNECYGSIGLGMVVAGLCDGLIGTDPFALEHISSRLYAKTRQASGGVNQQAIAAIENALIDVKARALKVPVYDLLGGAVRQSLELYWSHCGTYRIGDVAEHLGREPIETMADLESLGAEVRDRGFRALKTNIFLLEGEAELYMPGFTRGSGWPELNWSRNTIRQLRSQLEAIRSGAGPDVGIHLDLNFNFKTEGYLQVARALDDLGLTWFEIDSYDPYALRRIRDSVQTPIASCESLFGTRGFKPFFENYSMDVAIVDVPWNGIWTSLKIAALAEAYETNVAPHNFYGHVSTLMSAHFCAAIPNFRIMEIDIDDVSWKDEIVTHPPVIIDGNLQMSNRAGWGTDLVDEVINAHPPKRVKQARVSSFD